MKKIYYDITTADGCIGIIVSDGKEQGKAIPAGTTLYSMNIKDKNSHYYEYAEKYDINFIFEDDIPDLDFYAVPMINIFAQDSCGGLFGTVGSTSGTESGEPICYIDKNKKCFIIASRMTEFLEAIVSGGGWQRHMSETNDYNAGQYQITLCSTKDDAENHFEFIKPSIK